MQDLNLDKPPVTNRGVVNTEKSYISPDLCSKISDLSFKDLKMCVDWCQATIFGFENSIYDLFMILFGIESFNISFEQKGLFGYDKCYYYKDIKIFVSSKRDDMGYHIYLSGTACRQVEDLNINFINLFKNMKLYNCHFTRLDIAIDNFTNKYFTINRVKSSIVNKCVVSRFKNTIEFIKTKIDDGSNSGYTIWFGSRASKIQIVFYDKLKERESQNYLVDNSIKFWCRCEIRFRDDYANEVVLNLLDHDFNLYIKSVLSNYIKFVKYTDGDSNKSRWLLTNWWSDFLGDIPSVRLYNNGYVENIVKKRKWLEDSTSRSNAMVLLSTIENLSLDSFTSSYLVDYLNKGIININNNDLQLINEFRVKYGYCPIEFEDIKYLVGNIKDILIEKCNNNVNNGKFN